ncbi:MAG: GNAT family N-acetyltransferase [Solobacterium sp.]|nr:GNAT family N-acetyltransferase [Solobacterium sp.]
MEIRKAGIKDTGTVSGIVQATIAAVYPKYYPQGAVRFFSAHHTEEKIVRDIAEGKVFLLEEDGIPAGTVTVSANEICRLFVLPAFQHRGYGRQLMDLAEKKIFETYDTAVLDASLPAKGIYLKRGYRETAYHCIETGYGDHLCYDVMEKQLSNEQEKV